MKVLFIVNPIAGINRKVDLSDLIRSGMGPDHTTDIALTERAGHATILAKEAARNGYDAVIAVGGDGSMNEVASGLAGTSTALGLLPCGSGNGLARHLKIPLKLKQAVALINGKHSIRQIDAGKVNEHYFFSVAGIGFDALISREFAKHKGRGLITYIRSILKNITSYQARSYTIEIDGQHREVKAKFIALANSKQYGNNFLIAPDASVTDGLLDICLIRSFSDLLRPGPMISYLTGGYYKNISVHTLKMKNAMISASENLEAHVDGEPIETGKEVKVVVLEGALKVITA